MKTIFVLRHAKSNWSDEGKADFDRSLAKRGLDDAPLMGRVLALFDSVPDRILASPALRAKQTADIVAQTCGYQGKVQWEDSFYEGDSADFLAALRRLPDTVERPMLVAHNPGLEEFVADLCAAAPEGHRWAIRIPTAGLVCIDVDILDWASLQPGDGVLCWFIIPKLVKVIQK
jgi:phosphohistidine phosphatase